MQKPTWKESHQNEGLGTPESNQFNVTMPSSRPTITKWNLWEEPTSETVSKSWKFTKIVE